MRKSLVLERRKYLQAGGAVIIGSISGCSELSFGNQSIDLTIFNQSENPYTVELELIEQNGGGIFNNENPQSDTINIDPGGEINKNNFAKSKPYLIRYSIFRDNSTQTDKDHIHYHPNHDGTSITFDIETNGKMIIRG